jgi:hypothetical protein
LLVGVSENRCALLNEDFSVGNEFAVIETDSSEVYKGLQFYNVDTYAGSISPFTQTIFNNDDKIEYVRAVGEKSPWGIMGNITKYEVVNEDNEVLFTIEGSSNDSDLSIYRWHGKDYLFHRMYSSSTDTDIVNVYAINKDGNESSISKVKTMSGISAFPTLANRNNVVDVTIDEASAAEGGELVIVDNGGRVVAKLPFEPGQTTVPVRTSRMRTGVYNITLNNGAKIENARIIVK